MLVPAARQHESAVSTHVPPPSWSSPIPPPPSIPPSRSSRSTRLGSRGMQRLPTGYLFHRWQCLCVSAAVSICPTFSFPRCVHNSALYAGSLLLPGKRVHWCHLSRSRVYVLIGCLFFSFWLPSLCLTASRFIHPPSGKSLSIPGRLEGMVSKVPSVAKCCELKDYLLYFSETPGWKASVILTEFEVTFSLGYLFR